ncbi:MAG: MBOAT family protein, partial [Hyphomicrobiales bacterium]|nr:MBOAT family protein [Hyphomicrobiales bacterium]
ATFFPCVTAGPLVLQREIFDQMKERTDTALDFSRISAGLTMFSIGLFKKVVLADSIAPYANTAFNGVAGGQSIDIITAWSGAVAYTLQLYFDFSGYSDMALGLGAIFGIILPLNFNSPFKALNISDFWQRWHMTMTRFFTNYVYSPLAISGMRRAMADRYGPLRNYLVSGAWPIIFTMFVAGIWHGSGWVFVLYGLLHGCAIAVNNAWKQFNMPALPPLLSWLLTMSVVVSGLVIFRAADVPTALTILSSMWGISGLMNEIGTPMVTLTLNELLPMILVFGAIVLLAPNAQEILRHHWISSSPQPEKVGRLAEKFAWRPAFGWACASSIAFVVTFTNIAADSSFLYYQF